MDGDVPVFDGKTGFLGREIPFRADEDRDVRAIETAERLLDGNTPRVAFEAIGDEFERFLRLLRRLGMTSTVISTERSERRNLDEIPDGNKFRDFRNAGFEGLLGGGEGDAESAVGLVDLA